MSLENMIWTPRPYKEAEEKKEVIESSDTISNTIAGLVFEKVNAATVLENYGGEQMKVEISVTLNNRQYNLVAVGTPGNLGEMVQNEVTKVIEDNSLDGQVKINQLVVSRGVYEQGAPDKEYKEGGYIGTTTIV